MNIVVAGGTGFIGRALCHALDRDGHTLVVLTRRRDRAAPIVPAGTTVVEWNEHQAAEWESCLEGADAVINLAGAPIADARWTAGRKRVILDSRVGPTARLVDACSRRARRPAVLISASGVGFYGPRADDPVDETTPPGTGFMADLCVQWERAAMEGVHVGLRVVCVRTGMVLAKDGGALPRLALPFHLFLGGPVMPGTQWVSWIHRDDVIGLIRLALQHDSISGPMNAVAPHPVRMAEFSRALGRVMGRPSWVPVPQFVLETALGELATVMTTGQRVTPAVAHRAGFRFQYPELDGALRALYTRERAAAE